MDEMNIKSKFTTWMLSKAIGKALQKKLGYDIRIQLNEVKATINDGETHVHLDLDVKLSKEELMKILNNANLL